MQYVLIVGGQDAGKSTTVDAICKALHPTNALCFNRRSEEFEFVALPVDIINGTYVIEVLGKCILVVAGAPTEQRIRITALIEMCVKIKIKIDFAVVVMRSYERMKGYDTQSELKKYGDCVLEERITRIERDDFKETKEWQDRITKIVDHILASINR